VVLREVGEAADGTVGRVGAGADAQDVPTLDATCIASDPGLWYGSRWAPGARMICSVFSAAAAITSSGFGMDSQDCVACSPIQYSEQPAWSEATARSTAHLKISFADRVGGMNGVWNTAARTSSSFAGLRDCHGLSLAGGD
jgi:hypothetical protein